MTGSGGLRVALAGASGALALEVVAVMEERRLPVAEIRPFATEASLGQEVEFFDDLIPIEAAPPSLRGIDLLLLCTPRGPALDLVRQALREGVFCIDCSGSLAGSPEVPLLASDLCPPRAVLEAPVISTPAGPALPWALALAPLARAAGLVRVVGTVLQSASHAGRAGIEVLSRETLALLTQQELPPAEFFAGPVAFDCVPAPGEPSQPSQPEDGSGDESQPAASSEARREADVARDVRRLVLSAVQYDPESPSEASSQANPVPASETAGPGAQDLRIAVNAVQVPTFVAEGSALALQTERPLSPAEACEILQKASGVKLWEGSENGPSTRDAAAQDVALVGRVRRDASIDCGLQLWVAADPLRLAALNVVKLAETRLRLN